MQDIEDIKQIVTKKLDEHDSKYRKQLLYVLNIKDKIPTNCHFDALPEKAKELIYAQWVARRPRIIL